MLVSVLRDPTLQPHWMSKRLAKTWSRFSGLVTVHSGIGASLRQRDVETVGNFVIQTTLPCHCSFWDEIISRQHDVETVGKDVKKTGDDGKSDVERVKSQSPPHIACDEQWKLTACCNAAYTSSSFW